MTALRVTLVRVAVALWFTCDGSGVQIASFFLLCDRCAVRVAWCVVRFDGTES